MKKFDKSDIFYNVIKTNPKLRFFCYNGKIYVNNTTEEVQEINNFLQESQETLSLFDFEESFTYAGGWPGTIDNITYNWNPTDGEESLATPDFTEQTFTYAAGWPGTIDNITYDWNPAEGEESLATPDLTEDFTGGWP